MAKIEVHAGFFHKGGGCYMFGILSLRPTFGGGSENLPITDLATVELATEESVIMLGGTVGWGVAGAVILGPVGLLAGLLLGGRKKKVTFVAKLKDGRKMLASTDGKTYTKLQAGVF